jgi:hypothetical protein
VVQGLWARGYKSVLEQLKAMGFNALRLRFANQMLRDTSTTGGINFALNPDLQGLSPLQCLDALIAYCGELNLRVILNRYQAIPDNYEQEELWYLAQTEYNEAAFVADWVMLARRYAGSAVMAMDLWSEPRGLATWGTGQSTDWNLAAQRAGDAILAANPNLLIVVQGITANSWRGSNLENVRTTPVVLQMPNKVVYSVHEYPCEQYAQPWFSDPAYPNNLRALWSRNFGYISQEAIAPVLVGEFGTALSSECDVPWLRRWLNYTSGQYSSDGVNDLSPGQQGMSWMYLGVSPYGNIGGILGMDWQTEEGAKLAYLVPHMAPPLPSYDPAPSSRPSQLPTTAQPVWTPTASPSSAEPSADPSPVWPHPPASSKICRYSSFCTADSDCYPGNKCVPSGWGNSWCVEDPTTFLSTTCVATYGQCLLDANGTVVTPCCDPGAYCNYHNAFFHECRQPEQSSGLCANPSAQLVPTATPSSAPTMPVFGSLQTAGNQIVTSLGTAVRITGITW